MADEPLDDLRGALIRARFTLARHLEDVCPGPHSYVQHRDRRSPWCRVCGRNRDGDPMWDMSPIAKEARRGWLPDAPDDGHPPGSEGRRMTTTLSIAATPIEPALDLTIIRGAVWLFMGNECRPLTTEQTQAVADFVVNAADALVDAR